jgi:hypothetical protein
LKLAKRELNEKETKNQAEINTLLKAVTRRHSYANLDGKIDMKIIHAE